MSSVINEGYGPYTAMNVAALQSLLNSATVGWQSDRVDNQTSVLALNYEILIELTTANTAPANDQRAYVYAIPWMFDGSTWHAGGDLGTVTAPSGTQGTATIALPPNAKLLGELNYTTAQMTMRGLFNLCPSVGSDPPDGWSLVIINFTGAALATGCVVSYRALTNTIN